MRPATIVAEFRHAIELLAKLDDPAATQAAAVLSRWLAGEEFEAAAGLVPGWRLHLRLTARDQALVALVAKRADMNASELATWIVEGLERVAESVSGIQRPDGDDGLLADMVRAGKNPGWRQFHRLITEIRCHSDPCMAKLTSPSSQLNRRSELGTTTQTDD